MRPDVPGRLHVRGQLLPVEHSAHGVAGNEPPVAFTIACADVGEADALAIKVSDVLAEKHLANAFANRGQAKFGPDHGKAIKCSDYGQTDALAVRVAVKRQAVAVSKPVADHGKAIKCSDYGQADALAVRVAVKRQAVAVSKPVADDAAPDVVANYGLAVVVAEQGTVVVATVALAVEIASLSQAVGVAEQGTIVVATIALAVQIAVVVAHSASNDAAAYWPFAIASLGIAVALAIVITAITIAIKVANVAKAVALAVQGPDDFSAIAIALKVANVAKAVACAVAVTHDVETDPEAYGPAYAKADVERAHAPPHLVALNFVAKQITRDVCAHGPPVLSWYHWHQRPVLCGLWETCAQRTQLT